MIRRRKHLIVATRAGLWPGRPRVVFVCLAVACLPRLALAGADPAPRRTDPSVSLLAPGQPAASPASATGAAGAPPAPATSGLREPAPRPTAEVRVQNRFTHNLDTLQVFGGVDYLERRDFYVSPGVRLGATYYRWESLGLELQASHYFSSLNQAGQEVQHMLGVVPDSRAPTWLFLAGGRYALGFGKMMIGGLGRAIHFQPQAMAQAGIHFHGGSFGPSGLAGLGLMVNATPRWFFRLDGGMTVEVERRVTGTVTVVGFLPSLVTGGLF